MKLNVYDFDGTIYDGDSTVDFLKFLIKKKKSLIRFIPKFIINYVQYKLKLITKEKLKESFYSIFKYFNNIDDLIVEFWSINEFKIKDFFKNKKTHYNDIIATASPEFLIEPIAKKYKVKQLFGSKVNKKTGKYYGLNCHGKEKIKRIKKILPDAIIYKMYSDDSIADGPLLELAQKSYIVKGDEIVPYTSDLKKQNKFIDLFIKYKELISYLFVGGLTVLISLVTYYICVSTFLNPQNALQLQIANVISWIVSVCFAYFANRNFVFNSNNPNIIKESLIFFATRVITLLLDMLIMYSFVSILLINDKISKIISQILVIIANYIISKFFVFKD